MSQCASTRHVRQIPIEGKGSFFPWIWKPEKTAVAAEVTERVSVAGEGTRVGRLWEVHFNMVIFKELL